MVLSVTLLPGSDIQYLLTCAGNSCQTTWQGEMTTDSDLRGPG